MQTWKTWRCRLTQWFIANDINVVKDPAGVKRRAILLSTLSESTYKLAADLVLPKEVQEVPYEDIVSALDNHFTPKSVGFGERHHFYAATQLPQETPSQWAARLRGLTSQCNFSNVEEGLRDRFIMGMLPGVEKEKMYVQELAGLTFARAVELTESLRSARAAAAASAAAETVVTELYKIGKRSPTSVPQSAKVKCSVCGYSNHKAAECRFASYTCRKCNKKGHLRRMCKRINYVVTEENDEGDGDDGKICNIRSLRGEPLIEAVCVNGIRMNFEIDSGSAVTVMSVDTYNEHFKNIPLFSTNKKLLSYSGDVLGCAGRAQLLVEWRGRTRQLDVYVVRDGGPPLLGRDFIAQFELQLAPVYKCATTRDTLKLIQEQYPAVFSDKLGKFNKYKVNLKLKESAHPIFFKPRPVAFALREKVEKEINRLVGLGVLRPVEHSDYASPIVPVLKRDGSVRICADYSVTINKQLVVEQYPLPTVNELFSKLYGGQTFTKLDLSMAYGQFCLDEESQKLTCINTHKGIFAYTRLVFGLASGPSIFQRAMDTVLAGLDGTLCLLDDVLITGRNDSEHLERLHQVLQRLQDAGFVLQKSKYASPNGLGAILSQVSSDGQEKPISFASRTLNDAEKSGYNYVIEYVKSADNSADYLSRASLPAGAGACGGRGGGTRRGAGAVDVDAFDSASYVCFVVQGALPISVTELRLDDALENMISSCEVCMQLRPTPPRTPVCPWEYPPQPFYRVHLDFLGPLNGRMYLVLVDAYSKWLEVYEMASTTTSAVIERMYEYMSRYGLPHTKLSSLDNRNVSGTVSVWSQITFTFRFNEPAFATVAFICFVD
uniref:RNA-directed DNA polymerase n=1 Tax=Bombyx mori TaxID=7091 RepID=A0A8R2QY30_BOMMO|nr:uncharacterized protein K02A2.6-like [Bombyx mori]